MLSPAQKPLRLELRRDKHHSDMVRKLQKVPVALGYRQQVAILTRFHAAEPSQAQQVTNPKTNMRQFRLTPTDIAPFHRKFLTTTMIEAGFGVHRNRIRAVLSAAGAQPFTNNGWSVGSVLLREEVERHFRGN